MSDPLRFPDISDYYVGPLAEAEETAWNATKEYLRNAKTVADVLEAHPDIKWVMEFGCGSGLIPTTLPANVKYMGFDKNAQFLEWARMKNLGTKDRHFIPRDVRKVDAEFLRVAGVKPDLGVSFAFFKHFGLHEWDERVKAFLSLVPRAVFEVQLSTTNWDNGTAFHHTSVTMDRVEKVVAEAGHVILSENPHTVASLEDGTPGTPVIDCLLTTERTTK